MATTNHGRTGMCQARVLLRPRLEKVNTKKS